MRRSQSSPRYIALAVAIGFSIVAAALALFFIKGLTLSMMASKLLKPLSRLLLFILLGLFIGQIIEAYGWTRPLARVAGPLFRFGRLGNLCSAVFTTAFISGAAANAMLYDFYKDQKITKRQLYLTSLINQFPAYFLHLPTTFFIVIPLTGRAGMLYFTLTFVATVLRTIIFISVGRISQNPTVEPRNHPKTLTSKKTRPSMKTIWNELPPRLIKRITGIAFYVIPIYTAVFFLNALGVFGTLRDVLARYVTTAFIPMESLSIVILAFAAEFTSGFAAAGALLDAGALSIKQTVLALIIGNIIAFPIRALRHQLPRLMGIFTPKMGFSILLLGQGCRVVSLAGVTILYYLMA